LSYVAPPQRDVQVRHLQARVSDLEDENDELQLQIRVLQVKTTFHGERITEVEDRMTETEDYLRDE
jgi:peptidoglycan hydrolase CwlO-like protein